MHSFFVLPLTNIVDIIPQNMGRIYESKTNFIFNTNYDQFNCQKQLLEMNMHYLSLFWDLSVPISARCL